MNRGRVPSVVSLDRDTWQRSGGLCSGLIGTEERREGERNKKTKKKEKKKKRKKNI